MATRSFGALLDSGADASFMDAQYANDLGVTTVPLEQQLKASSLDGRPLWYITHLTTPLFLIASGDQCNERVHSVLSVCWNHLSIFIPHWCWLLLRQSEG